MVNLSYRLFSILFTVNSLLPGPELDSALLVVEYQVFVPFEYLIGVFDIFAYSVEFSPKVGDRHTLTWGTGSIKVLNPCSVSPSPASYGLL